MNLSKSYNLLNNDYENKIVPVLRIPWLLIAQDFNNTSASSLKPFHNQRVVSLTFEHKLFMFQFSRRLLYYAGFRNNNYWILVGI